MVATVVVQEANGVTPTLTTVTTARFCTTDAYNPEATYPCVVPTEDFNFSYWKSWRLNMTDSFTTINNIRIYSDGTINWGLGTGGDVLIGKRDSGDNGCPSGSYEQAAGTAGTTGYSIMDATYGHDYYNTQDPGVADIQDYTSGGTQLLLDSTDYGPEASNSKYAVMQVKIGTDATQGTKAAETLTLLYDEI